MAFGSVGNACFRKPEFFGNTFKKVSSGFFGGKDPNLFSQIVRGVLDTTCDRLLDVLSALISTVLSLRVSTRTCPIWSIYIHIHSLTRRWSGVRVLDLAKTAGGTSLWQIRDTCLGVFVNGPFSETEAVLCLKWTIYDKNGVIAFWIFRSYKWAL